MYIRKSMLALSAATALTWSGAALAQAAGASDYVMKAGASDLYEMQSSQLVLQTTQDPKVKTYANKMIKDHTKSTAMVKAAATKAGMTPAEPMLDADGQQMISQLQAAQGPERDKLYMQQQMMSHDKALSLQQDYASNGDSKPLKSAAAKIVPVVQSHKAMMSSMPGMSGM